MAADQDTTTAALGYEQARDELIDVVRRLEAGGATLEESLALWERGEELARVCRHWLEGARRRLDAALAADDEEAEAGAGTAGTSAAAGEDGRDGQDGQDDERGQDGRDADAAGH